MAKEDIEALKKASMLNSTAIQINAKSIEKLAKQIKTLNKKLEVLNKTMNIYAVWAKEWQSTVEVLVEKQYHVDLKNKKKGMIV